MIRSALFATAVAAAVTAAAAPARAEASSTPPPSQSSTEASTAKTTSSSTEAETEPPRTERMKESTQPEPPLDTSLDSFRHPVDALTEQLIGSASKSVRFDWRKKLVGFGLVGGELIERNNFGSGQLGVFVKKPLGDLTVDVAVTRVWSWSTDSSEKLALTPFRQAGRPTRFELQANATYPLAEGVVTALNDIAPPAELVWNVNAGARYLLYPELLPLLRFDDPLAAGQVLAGPTLSDTEVLALDRVRLGGMQVDASRYQVLVGSSLDVYVPPGFFVEPRALLAIPVFGVVNQSALGFWWELSLAVGWML